MCSEFYPTEDDLTNIPIQEAKIVSYRYEYTDGNQYATGVLLNIPATDEPLEPIYEDMLERARRVRYNSLFHHFKGDLMDSSAVRDYLPVPYKSYASHLSDLKKEMASLWDIINKYKISNIQCLETLCNGCIYDYPGQEAHTECPTGCLHDRDLCLACT